MLCVTQGLLPFDNPFLLSNCPLCLFSPPPLRISEGSFSFCTRCLLSQRLAWKDQTLLLPHYYFLKIIDYILLFCTSIIFLSPSLILTSSSRLTHLHCNINSKLYSMLSTCLSVPPILSTSASLPRFLTAGRITVRLRGGDGTR